ncbi:MAG: hypothetical protein Q4C97_02680 [Bacillota bacterium]|nr:hypothetical protein [Bacillota bacterium]
MAIERIFKDFIRFAQCNELKLEGIAIADENRVIVLNDYNYIKRYKIPGVLNIGFPESYM